MPEGFKEPSKDQTFINYNKSRIQSAGRPVNTRRRETELHNARSRPHRGPNSQYFIENTQDDCEPSPRCPASHDRFAYTKPQLQQSPLRNRSPSHPAHSEGKAARNVYQHATMQPAMSRRSLNLDLQSEGKPKGSPIRACCEDSPRKVVPFSAQHRTDRNHLMLKPK